MALEYFPFYQFHWTSEINSYSTEWIQDVLFNSYGKYYFAIHLKLY